MLAHLSNLLFRQQSSPLLRILLVAVAAVLGNVLIRMISATSEWLVIASHKSKRRLWSVAQKPKFVTLLRLGANTATSGVYFVAVGLILKEAGVNLAAYLASASIVGLAISFGSQSLVQDVVIGLTLLFSDAIEVDDMAEIAGVVVVVGRVQEIGLRFTKLVNLYNQVVFVPNRTIANVSRYPEGGVYAYADVQIPGGADPAKAAAAIRSVVENTQSQFTGIILEAAIVNESRSPGDEAWRFVRVRLKIWPGQGALIETTFRQRMLRAMRVFDPNYSDWQVPVFYRADQPTNIALKG